MKCVHPFIKDGRAAFGCGQCMPCRLLRQRVWYHRIILESLCHASSAFVTLTYSPECEPGDGSLRPIDVQKWLKRLRRRFHPQKFRVFYVGEYGDRFSRPHYHAALFGYPNCVGGPVCHGVCECRACLGVRETWGFGHVFVGRLEIASARYIARYTLKKLTSSADARLGGRSPEFMRCSNRPGIGVDAMWDVASVLLRYPEKPIPNVLMHAKRPLPLGRYLRLKLAEMVDREVEPYVDNVMPAVSRYAYEANTSLSSVFQRVNGPGADRASAKLSTELPISTRLQTQSKREII